MLKILQLLIVIVQIGLVACNFFPTDESDQPAPQQDGAYGNNGDAAGTSHEDNASDDTVDSEGIPAADEGRDASEELRVSDKRGLAYGYHSPGDLNVMQNKVAWWYNWSETPEDAVAGVYQDYHFDFVPMVWDERFDENRLRQFLSTHPDVKYLLGFNEPNFVEQANLTPAQVAQQWPRLEAIAEEFDLKIVGPAVNYSPGQVDIPGTEEDFSPFAFLDAFFEACPNCQVDYIAVHCFMKYASALEWYIGEFERYGRPIWLTEWASWDEGGPAYVGEQMDYLAETVRWLEDNGNVFRYSWFIGRWEGKDAFPFIDILDLDGELTPLGGLYTSIPSNAFYYTVPARIEAEGAHRIEGFAHEPTRDADGGYVNLYQADPGDTLEYQLMIPASGSYRIDLRLAASSDDRRLRVTLDGEELAVLTIGSTGGSQNWRTFAQECFLPQGRHNLRIETLTDGLNLNWLEIVSL